MKYYIYISDAKVDMLYPQIPQSLLKKIAANLSIDLKFFGAELSVAGKSSASDETRYAKVQIVSEYIEKHQRVGWIDAHEAYVKGILPVHWTLVPQKNSKIVYFGGSTASTILILVGSAHHVIGNRNISPTSSDEAFMIPYTYSALVHIFQTGNPPGAGLIDLLKAANSEMKGPTQQVEFLAKTLFCETVQGETQMRFLVGTPIYVAITD